MKIVWTKFQVARLGSHAGRQLRGFFFVVVKCLPSLERRVCSGPIMEYFLVVKCPFRL